jgi:hypothetical protein
VGYFRELIDQNEPHIEVLGKWVVIFDLVVSCATRLMLLSSVNFSSQSGHGEKESILSWQVLDQIWNGHGIVTL